MTEAQTPALEPCPFCGAHLTAPTSVQYPQMGLARLHPGSTDDGSCPLAGWGFYEHQLENWNTRAKPALETVVVRLSDDTLTLLANQGPGEVIAHPLADRALLDDVREQVEREAEARIVAWIREKALSAWGADCSGMDEITFIATTISQGAHKQ